MHSLTAQENAPERREIDGSTECHDDHENPLMDHRTCEKCAEWLKERAEQVSFEFHFTVEDVAKAEAWAEAHRYRYESLEHLLHDALIEKVIHTDKWKAA